MKVQSAIICWVVISATAFSVPSTLSAESGKKLSLKNKVKYVIEHSAATYEGSDDPEVQEYSQEIIKRSDESLLYVMDQFDKAKSPTYARYAVNFASHLKLSNKEELRGFIRNIISKERTFGDENNMVEQLGGGLERLRWSSTVRELHALTGFVVKVACGYCCGRFLSKEMIVTTDWVDSRL